MNNIVGNWSPYSTDLGDKLEVFKEATKGILGVDYTPFAVSTQVVSGINYRFLCNAKIVYPGGDEYGALVSIYEGEGKAPVVTEIHKI